MSVFQKFVNLFTSYNATKFTPAGVKLNCEALDARIVPTLTYLDPGTGPLSGLVGSVATDPTDGAANWPSSNAADEGSTPLAPSQSLSGEFGGSADGL